MSLMIDNDIGLERIGREALMILVDGLNPALAARETEWLELDQQLAMKLGRTPTRVTIPSVNLENFHLGHRQSVVEAPIDAFPNVCVMAWNAQASDPGFDLDQADAYADQLYVEMLAHAEDEDTANRRIQRMAEAANAVLMADKTLNGLVSEINATPSLSITDVFPRREEKGRGTTWWWQGARLEYTIVKHAIP